MSAGEGREAGRPLPSPRCGNARDKPQERCVMPRVVKRPAIVLSAGNKPKRIEEFVGRVVSGTHSVSIARMKSPKGWEEPGQTPAFDEYTLVLTGTLRVESAEDRVDVAAGQAVIVPRGEWVRYSTPEGAEYVAVCVPAFSPETVHRDP